MIALAAKRLLPALLALVLALALASCGGGGSTTITRNETVMRHAKRHPVQTFLPDVATDRRFVEPVTYGFSVDGDLVAKGLRWHDWGEAKATAFGTIAERPASGLVDTFQGSVTAAAPKACQGARYYTEVFAHVPKQADFVPSEPTKLSTPCD
ncbi:MAG TPA: hypothetical protein VMF55_04735 [Solirubrobacterales bacterium]|nr:hypothetical protein [Solirubrobacterales bacterium]